MAKKKTLSLGDDQDFVVLSVRLQKSTADWITKYAKSERTTIDRVVDYLIRVYRGLLDKAKSE